MVVSQKHMFKNINAARLRELYNQSSEFESVINDIQENHRRTIASLGHEIRNPLTLLYGHMQLLEKKHPQLSDDPLWLSALDDFHYTHLLLDQISLYNNSTTLSIETVDCDLFFNDIALSFANSLGNNDAYFTSDIHTLGNRSLDKIKIRQVLINLLKNAKEATSKGDHITLTAALDKDLIVIKVSDSGCGIPPNQLENIFSPFVTHKEDGTGLGLSICKEIVEGHDGTLTVSSTYGVKTCFFINLPTR